MKAGSSSIALWIGLAVIVVLIFAGVTMLIYAVLGIVETRTALEASATPVAVVNVTQPVIPPTQVQPTVPEQQPTPTSTGPAATPTLSNELTITVAANVRSGPGTNYPVIGGFQAGAKVTVIGRDSAAQWFVITYEYGYTGQGWVSGLASRYDGDINALPVIAAPPPPPPTAVPTNTPVPTAVPPTAIPATATPAAVTSSTGTYNSRGIESTFFYVENASVGAGEKMWFNWDMTNTTDSNITFTVLAPHSAQGPNKDSWTSYTMGPHWSIVWRDWMSISTPGTYKIYLGVCYGADTNQCLTNNAPWERLSADLTVVVH